MLNFHGSGFWVWLSCIHRFPVLLCWNPGISRGCCLIRASNGERSVSRPPQAIGRIHLLMIARLRSWFLAGGQLDTLRY